MEDDVAGRRSPSRRRSFDMLDGLGYTATAVMLILMWSVSGGGEIGVTCEFSVLLCGLSSKSCFV